MTRWSLIVSEATDQRLRAFLGQRGAKKGDLSRFVEEAVNKRLHFEETVDQIKTRNQGVSHDALVTDIDDAIRAARAPRT